MFFLLTAKYSLVFLHVEDLPPALFSVQGNVSQLVSQYAGSKSCFVMDSSLIFAQWLSKTLLYTKTGIEKNKMIY